MCLASLFESKKYYFIIVIALLIPVIIADFIYLLKHIKITIKITKE